MYKINKLQNGKRLYGIFTLVGKVSEISLVQCAHSFDFRYFGNSCESSVRARFPWTNLYVSSASPSSERIETAELKMHWQIDNGFRRKFNSNSFLWDACEQEISFCFVMSELPPRMFGNLTFFLVQTSRKITIFLVMLLTSPFRLLPAR